MMALNVEQKDLFRGHPAVQGQLAKGLGVSLFRQETGGSNQSLWHWGESRSA